MNRKPIFYRFLLLSFFISFGFFSTSQAQVISTFAGDGTVTSLGDGGPALSAGLHNPSGVYIDPVGNFYIIEYTGAKIRKVNTSGIISTFAGSGVTGFSGDGGPATAARFNKPIDMLADQAGNLYVIDNGNQRIRKIDTFGVVTTFAGNGVVGYSGDGGPATAASLHDPSRMTMDAVGNIFFADAMNNVIRKITPAGIITSVVGNGTAGFSGDGGPATAGSLSQPLGVAFDGNYNMYIADGNNHRIRKVSASGVISTFAGNGLATVSGDGGPATAASMKYPNGITTDISCNVYFSDWQGQTIREIGTDGIINTVVGNGTAGFSGDGGNPVLAQLNGPNNLIFEHSYTLYIPEYYNNRVRKVTHLGDVVTGCPPTIPVAAGGASASFVCQDSCLTFTSTSGGTHDSIRWTSSYAGTVIANPVNAVTNICFLGSDSSVVKLFVYGSGVVDSISITIHINPAPHPVITKAGHLLTVTGGAYSAYQWYSNVTPIAGATNATYTYTAGGVNYNVVVDSAGCKGVSNTVSTVGIESMLTNSCNYWLAQNGRDIISLRASNSIQDALIVTVYDATGRSIITDNWLPGNNLKEINCAYLPSGLYIVRITNGNTFATLKLIRN